MGGVGHPTALGSRGFNTPQGRKSPARSGCAGRGKVGATSSGTTVQRSGRGAHGTDTGGQGAATTQHSRRAGVLVAPSREAPSRPPTTPEAQGAHGRPCKLRHRDPPATPGTRRIKPRKRRRMLCFSTNWAIKRINPRQREQEESYVQDFQFHRQR